MTEFWEKRYSEPEFAYGSKPNEYFKQCIDILAPGKLLLPGEGEGRNAVYAARLGWDVTALDISKAGKIKALKLAEKHNVSINYIVTPIELFDFRENEYDAAALIFAHFPALIRETIHRSVIRSLKPGGSLIVEAFSKKQINNTSGGPKEISMLYTSGELKGDFEALIIKEFNENSIELNEGKYHVGKADVIRILGTKK